LIEDTFRGDDSSANLGLVKKLGFVLAPARTRLTPPAEAAASQKWKIIYLQVLSVLSRLKARLTEH